MELYKEILSKALSKERFCITFPDLQLNCNEIVESQSYIALNQIKNIIRDDSLNDNDCFEKIERIICELESLGIDCGSRHDFG